MLISRSQKHCEELYQARRNFQVRGNFQARGNKEWCAANFRLYNIPGLRKAPPSQANNIIRHGYNQEN